MLVVSDVHGRADAVRALESEVSALGVDIAVCCGDLETSDVVDALAELDVDVYAIPGNMDNYYLLEMLESYGLSIHGKAVELRGVTLAGVGGLDPLRALEEVREALASASSELVVVSHYPPHGTKVDVAYSGLHIGLEELRELVEEARPRLVACGHVHESRGVDRVGGALVVNPGPLAWGLYAVVDLSEERVVMRRLGQKMPG